MILENTFYFSIFKNIGSQKNLFLEEEKLEKYDIIFCVFFAVLKYFLVAQSLVAYDLWVATWSS